MQPLHRIIKRWLASSKPRTREQSRTLSLREMRSQYLLDPNRPSNAPTPFGYRMGWLALRTTDTQAVLHCLRLTDPQAISWGAGMLAQERSWEADRGEVLGGQREGEEPRRSCFVTPCVRGWTLVLGPFRWGISWRYQERESLITKLSRSFGEVQSFLTDRIPEIHHWMQAREGVLLRSFVYDGEKGIIWSDYGALTSVEQGFDWTGLYDLRWFPDEEDVLRVAAAWSLNPATLDTIDPAGREGTGVLAQVPREALLDRFFLLARHPPTASLDPTSTWEVSWESRPSETRMHEE
jgi:hypothetical protein